MGHKVNPIAFRLGVFGKSWLGKWFANKKDYGLFLQEDFEIRKKLLEVLPHFNVEDIGIERTGTSIKVVLNATNIGLVIGKKGQGLDSLKSILGTKFGKSFDIVVKDVKVVDLSAKLLANSIADQIEKRINFKKAMKRAGFLASKAGARGIKICCSGRLGGAEIARIEWFRYGSVPLHTIRSNIDYALTEAKTIYGMIGVKVWICKGEY